METNSDNSSGAASTSSGGETGGSGTAGAATSGGPAAGSAAATSGADPAKAPGDGGAPPAYSPNYKYKVTAGQQKLEKEIPEWARPLVTSADAEKSVRELFEKSDGLDVVKQHRDLLVQENSQMREQWAPIVQNVRTVVGHLQRGDLDSFFEAVNLPEADILKYALYRLQLRENPEQMQTHDQMRQLQLQNQELQNRVQQYSGGYENLAVQQRTMQLDGHLARPEILGAVQAFDARMGTPGAFRNEVIRRGQMYAAAQQDVSVEQAANEVLQLIGWQGQNPPQATVQNAGQAGASGAGTPQSQKPTFPNVRGKGTSPAKSVVRSTDDLRKLASARG